MPEEFSFIDRCALVVRPTWKFVEWLNQLDTDPIEDEASVYISTVYLVEEVDRMDALGTAALLDAHFPSIAANEFEAWWTEPNDWPPIRTINEFFQYFEVLASETVVDLLSDESYDN
jgi:hypothetical protein